MQNEIRNPETRQEPVEKTEKQGKSPSLVKASDFGSFLSRENLPVIMPYIAMFTVLAIAYIANAHYAERMVRRTDKMAKEIKELRAEYISIKSDLMYRSKQSQIARRLESAGLKELRTPPKKIIIPEDEY